jgi:hypothetical protein
VTGSEQQRQQILAPWPGANSSSVDDRHRRCGFEPPPNTTHVFRGGVEHDRKGKAYWVGRFGESAGDGCDVVGGAMCRGRNAEAASPMSPTAAKTIIASP